MTNAFVDTTIVCEVLLGEPSRALRSKNKLHTYARTTLPEYVLKEFRAGLLQNYIYAHNLLVASPDIESAVERLALVAARAPRKGTTGLLLIVRQLIGLLDKYKRGVNLDSGHGAIDAKQQIEAFLLKRIFLSWQKRRAVTTDTCQPLSCFADAELHLDDANQIRSREGLVSGCRSKSKCGAAVYLLEKRDAVEKVIKLLRPKKNVQQKPEWASRRRALKKLLEDVGAISSAEHCRALGDAYIGIMAIPGNEILTTNISDFQLMASSLGLTIASP